MCAHCTCKAGLAEACSHNSAVCFFFSLLSRTKLVQNVYIASLQSQVGRASSETSPVLLKDIDFTNPETQQSGPKRRKSDDITFKPVAPPTKGETESFYRSLAAGGKPALFLFSWTLWELYSNQACRVSHFTYTPLQSWNARSQLWWTHWAFPVLLWRCKDIIFATLRERWPSTNNFFSIGRR